MTSPSFFTAEQYADYRNRLETNLVSQQLSVETISKILNHADNLQKNEVPIIFDQPHLAGLLGYDLDYVQVLSTCQQDFYIEFKIPKRNGKLRVIHEPMPNLKEIQTWILNNILMSPGVLKRVSPVATAFLPKLGIKNNAISHVGKRTVICMDLKDFFGSTRYIQVYIVFQQLGYSKDVAGMLAHLCTLNDVLPQGAPTSPMLSNLVFSDIDSDLKDHCQSLGVEYSRYADDLTFSTNAPIDYGQLIGRVKVAVSKGKFDINKDKTKVCYRNQSQIVTGIVVNEFPQVGKTYRKRIRQELYYLRKYGLEDHYSRASYSYGLKPYLNHLLGKIDHVLYVNKDDKEMQGYKEQLKLMIEKRNK